MRYKQLTGYQDVMSYQLQENGLKLLLVPNPLAPVVGCQITYHVGSRNEAIGYTGATHLLEHLMFKGSKQYNKSLGNSIDTLENFGGVLNATTWNDRTNYYAVVPKNKLDLSLAMEADRMRNAFIDESDRQAEMTVVRNEFDRGENDAISALHKNIWATAYQAHPYHHDTIGWLSDIENVSIERLKAFYDTFYWPNNATLSIFGDFDQENVLDLVWQHFGSIPASPNTMPKMYTKEPHQEGMRRFEVKRQENVAWVGVAHKVPEASHPDHLPLQLLDRLLGHGRCSRLYRGLIDKGFANRIYVDVHPFKDPGLFITYVMCSDQVDHHQIEKLVLDQYDDVIKNGVTADEIARSKHQLKAEKAFLNDGMHGLMSAVNEGISIGDWAYYLDYANRLEAVSAEDIQRVAGKYFLQDQMTVGHYMPRKMEAVV